MWYWRKRPLLRWALWSENHILKLHISLTQTLKKCKHIASINVVHNVSCCLACNKSIRNEAIPECSLAISLASKFISRHKDFPTFSAWRTPRIITSRHFHLKRGRPSVNFYNNQKQVLFISYNVMQTLLTYLNLTRSYQASTVGILLYYFFYVQVDHPWGDWPAPKAA